MRITEARKIAGLVNNEQFKGFQNDVRTAFHVLDRSANKGNKDDRKLAKILWDHVGFWQ